MSDELKRKLTSRKFWLAVAAFLGSIGGSITGLATGNDSVATVGMVCAALSAAIYAAMEAVVDYGRETSSSAFTSTTVTLEGSATKANLEQVSNNG